ncbi:hypothetical protein P154DRAFT_536074 [Amniculicola lignicola CBS 123094]|uniref:Uncharacterized protein n=1 Tax=Amniculicola lignicola CBS 123094 TaxID=1392246 RepID=A0A6A5WHV9_9PLEO|nr:hypothetical protein P154DRAFT_536074 [Amniculicola lignicola CBS 123094]
MVSAQDIECMIRWATDFWTDYCNRTIPPPYAITEAQDLVHKYPTDIKYHEKNSTKFYQIHKHASTVGNKTPVADAALLQASRFYNTCCLSVVMLWEALSLAFEDQPWFLALSWRRAKVHPPAHVFFKREYLGSNPVHDFLVLDTTDQLTYVLDFTGAQFGFKKMVYTLEEYGVWLPDGVGREVVSGEMIAFYMDRLPAEEVEEMEREREALRGGVGSVGYEGGGANEFIRRGA